MQFANLITEETETELIFFFEDEETSPEVNTISPAMATEGGGSKRNSTQEDERLERPCEDQRIEDAETANLQTSIKKHSHEASAMADSSSADPEESETRLCGWLNKCGNIGFVKTAKPLWFVFSDDTCKLYFYRNPQDLLPLGEIDIKHASFYFDANNHRPGLFEIR